MPLVSSFNTLLISTKNKFIIVFISVISIKYLKLSIKPLSDSYILLNINISSIDNKPVYLILILFKKLLHLFTAYIKNLKLLSISFDIL